VPAVRQAERSRRLRRRRDGVREEEMQSGEELQSGGEVQSEEEQIKEAGMGEEEVPELPSSMLSEEALQNLENLQPGKDGSVLCRRAQPEPYNPTDGCDRDAMKRYLIDEFKSYCKYGYSQEAVGENLRRQKKEVGMR
jgi:hypothetical protein